MGQGNNQPDIPESPSTVSLIIVNWNGEQYLDECLSALQRQSRLPDEIILVDNASTDASLCIVSRYANVTIVSLPKNLGFAGGNLAGFQRCTGAYIVLLNNDTRPEPGWLENLVGCAELHPDVGMVASHITDWEGNYTDSAGDAVNVLGRARQLGKGRPAISASREQYVFSVCAGAALYKRTMLDDVGFLDGSFFMNAEDSDLAYRAQLRGWKGYFCPMAVVRHRISASQIAGSAGNVYYNARNHIWSYVKNMPSELIVKYGWLLLADLTLKALFATWTGTLPAYLHGLYDGFTGILARLPERCHIQSRRTVPVSELEASLTYPRLIRRITGER